MSAVEIKITEKLLLNAGGWNALKPARELHKSGRVSDVRYEAPLLTGIVREGARNYRAGLRVKTAVDVENVCTCYESRAWGKICAHSIAVGLEYLTPTTNEPVAAVAPAPAPVAQKPATNFVFDGGAEGLATKLHFILPPNFAAAWDRGQVMLVAEAESEGQRTLISALKPSETFACDGEDLTAIEGLRQFPALFESGILMLDRAEFLRLLPVLQNHPRVTFGKTMPVKISLSTLRPTLHLQQKIESRISARIELRSDAKLLAEGADAWLLSDKQFIRCAEELTPQTAELLTEARTYEGDRALRFLALDLPRLREHFDIVGDKGVVLRKVSEATPVFVLRLAGTLHQLTAELFCKYVERPPLRTGADPDDVFVFRDPKNAQQLLTRNLTAEQRAVSRMIRSGFAQSDSEISFTLNGQTDVVHFFATEYPLMQMDWTVTLTAQVEKWSGEIERVTPKIEVVSSGVDWFELRYSLTTPSGQEFSSIEMQRLLRSGQTQTRLRNGRTAVFDAASLEDFEQVIRDCDPTQNQPGIYRIKKAHAGYIEATARTSAAIMGRGETLQKFLASDPADAARLRTKLGTLATVLRDYQLDGVAWLARLAANKLGGILADEMGLGKTVQMLAFLRALKSKTPALVVCPTSLVTNWENEARKFTPELSVLRLEGADRATRFNEIPKNDIVVTSYALLRRDYEQLLEYEFSTAVLDEAQHIKNPDTQNAQAAYSIRADHRFVLTGTPMENSVRDLWSIMNFVVPGYLGIRVDFRERYEQPLARGPAPDVQRRLSRRLQPFLLRRKKRDVAKDLPDKLEQVVPVDLTSSQRNAYDALLREIQLGLGSTPKDRKSGAQRMKMLTGLLRLRQVCCDLRLVGIEKPDPSGKLELLDELLGEAIDGEHRVLLFSQFVSMLHLVRERLEKLKLPFCYLDGQTKDRQAIVDRFQADAQIPVFLISLKAGGVGLNLSAADTVIHFDPWWNPAVEGQATDRAHRIGQTRVVTAYKLITRDTVEEKILRLQEKKRAAIDAMMESEEPLMSGLSTEELAELLT